jgi:hypothetical protein
MQSFHATKNASMSDSVSPREACGLNQKLRNSSKAGTHGDKVGAGEDGRRGARRGEAARRNMPLWTWLVPVLALALLHVALAAGMGTWLAILCGAALVGAVLVAVHHAEVVAHRVGKHLGTLLLALVLTAIETALILSIISIKIGVSRDLSWPASRLSNPRRNRLVGNSPPLSKLPTVVFPPSESVLNTPLVG